jgi:transcriptional regulator with XRE-family HTH domain
MTDNRKRFGQRIRSVREAAHSSRERVAARAKIGVNYLGQIERGEKWPTLDVIVNIAKGIGVSPSVFLELDPVGTEPEALRLAINDLLRDRDSLQLQLVFRLVKALLVG